MLEPATTPTMYFIGVTTTKSSIMKVFPAWNTALGLGAVIKGIDLPLDSSPEKYREVVEFIKSDPKSLGALVTTHKLNLYKSCRDLFDGVGESAALLEEVSSISKRGVKLWGHAMDPITAGLSLEAIVPDGYWSASGAEMLLLGAGGSSLALTLYLHERQATGKDVPARIVVTNRRGHRIDEMRDIHKKIGWSIPTDYVVAGEPELNDAQLATMAPGSVVINATGLGKDRPGSPLTWDAAFPDKAIAWDFNYRGDLVFLDQARAQEASAGVRIEDGWLYFIHGWTRVIAEVFHIDIPTSGPQFERLANIAKSAN